MQGHHPQGALATNAKTFRIKRNSEDWARRTEDDMVRGNHVQRRAAERMTVEAVPAA